MFSILQKKKEKKRKKRMKIGVTTCIKQNFNIIRALCKYLTKQN